MIQFNKLRLHGFKSFVEKTELEIGPGLTGIVGPNGCGKSNLVEALRWCMGESSTKRMRGGSRSMEDVIFAGTGNRPQRNSAEVSIVLDNSKHTAPPPYNNIEEIEVARKIERDHGSSYRINGKSVRARDVQMLFADMLSGANSPYLVSQGRITQIIQAKPLDRRMILEEAAGITGLYARRHEAELRLRATDNNLKRLEDIVGSMEERLNNLKKQARQATRYRNLSSQIRQLEISIASLEWRQAHEKLRETETSLGEFESSVAERMIVVNQLNNTYNVQSEDLPDLRQKDADAGAVLQNKRLAHQRLEDEQERLSQSRDEAKAQLEQITHDRGHEQQSLEETSSLLEKLAHEEKNILEKQNAQDTEIEEKTRYKEECEALVSETESTLDTLMEEHTEAKAQKQGLERQIEQDTLRLERLNERLSSLKEKLTQETEENKDSLDTQALRSEIEEQESKLSKLKEEAESEKLALDNIRQNIEEARKNLSDARSEKEKLTTEISTLESFLNSDSKDEYRPVFEEIEAESGFETALSRALGDSLTASMDENAPVVWQQRSFDSSLLPALPEGAAALEPHVKAPSPVKLALMLIGFVEDDETGHEIAKNLKAGQSLVSRSGAYWRWDGLYMKNTASDSHAQQLKQKNKLAALQKDLPEKEKESEDALTKLEALRAQEAAAQERLNTKNQSTRELDDTLRQQQKTLNHAVESQADKLASIAALEESIATTSEDITSLKNTVEENKTRFDNIDTDSIEAQQARITELKEKISGERETLQDAISALNIVAQEQNRRKARIQAIGDERVSLKNRSIRAGERLEELAQRETALTEKLEELKKRPSEIKTELESLLDAMSVLEKDKTALADRLASLEGELAETNKGLKEAEASLSSAKEKRASAQAKAEERRDTLNNINAHIQEQFDMSPESLMAEAALDTENLPALDGLKTEKEKAVRSRDMIGPVNLMAEQEAETLEKELTDILAERNDLMEAINELRQGIQKLNKEARERLQAAFERVNEHFRDMFSRLFIGGKAHLALIESDDPLEAGLEIFAQPPGKALQSLSLLSGGEQTLTAVALIFAMFLTNPAPICVLDEVDAPLDDANVDRFCDLLEEFADRGHTRFMVISHHRMTMARMDRLYGVTMMEKGVSKLVSVDMNQQLSFLDAA